MMRIALVGYGKMGKAIDARVSETEAIVLHRIDPSAKEANHKRLSLQLLAEVDVCIDFSHPAFSLEHMNMAAKSETPLVMGTTGWHEHLTQAKQLFHNSSSALIYAENFSLGVNVFMEILKSAANICNRYPEYDVSLVETHHRQKIDAPSGTALAMSALLLAHIDRKEKVHKGSFDQGIDPNALSVSSVRSGFHPGEHKVLFDSEIDTIALTHTTRSRKGLAQGALHAARWIQGKKGFFHISQLIEENSHA